ncbi:hypothetical protein CEP52_003710 [Fusarium oligoseptatum]|uniref:Uncharacterized protein n=1 Tax=Fusarium oligoseptatum TaxID=2604345 RepID=A0A428U7X2_9HYPO|nr:hypothetical protein CEP52_003710 [Fusarium oligoseptatum]
MATLCVNYAFSALILSPLSSSKLLISLSIFSDKPGTREEPRCLGSLGSSRGRG